MSLWKYPSKIASWIGAIFLILSTILVTTPTIASAAITQTDRRYHHYDRIDCLR